MQFESPYENSRKSKNPSRQVKGIKGRQNKGEIRFKKSGSLKTPKGMAMGQGRVGQEATGGWGAEGEGDKVPRPEAAPFRRGGDWGRSEVMHREKL